MDIRTQTGLVLILVATLVPTPGQPFQKEPEPETQKYRIEVIEGAAKFRRGKRGKVNSQAVIKVTDENNVPVAGIVVAFTIPMLSGGGASFADGASTTTATTNASGVASASFSVAPDASEFSISATASTPGSAVTASVPVSMSAAAAAGTAAGVSTALIATVVAVGAAAAVGVGVAVTRGNSASPQTAGGTVPVRIGVGGPPTLGVPR